MGTPAAEHAPAWLLPHLRRRVHSYLHIIVVFYSYLLNHLFPAFRRGWVLSAPFSRAYRYGRFGGAKQCGSVDFRFGGHLYCQGRHIGQTARGS